jgi:general secretion pathway protein I
MKKSKFLILGFPSSRAGGFTFIEVFIALAIVGGVLITLIYSLNYHLTLAQRHETITVATLLARHKLLDMEKNPEDKKGTFEKPYNKYTYETYVKDSPYPGIKEIAVVVKSGEEEVRLNGFVFK